MLGALSRLPSWELDHTEEDVRGWPLRDEAGTVLGKVSDLIVDTDTRYVAQVLLSDGRRFPAHDVYIGDDYVGLRRERPLAKGWADPAVRVAPKGDEIPKGDERARSENERGIDTPAASSPPPAVTPESAVHLREGASHVPSSELTTTRRLISQEGDLIVPVVNEELEVATQRVDAGGVGVQSHMEERPTEKSIWLREEHVTVERTTTDRPLTAQEAEARFKDAELEMRAKAEVPVVGKRAHVVEEVWITKTTTERVEKVQDTVRRTSVDVTELPKRAGSNPRK